MSAMGIGKGSYGTRATLFPNADKEVLLGEPSLILQVLKKIKTLLGLPQV